MQQFDVDTHLAGTRQQVLTELGEYIRIPSVSAEPARREDVRRSVEFIGRKLESLGLTTTIQDIPGAKLGNGTPGHPMLYAERIVDPSLPTIAFYMHTDVQPIPPTQAPLWVNASGREIDPFKPNYMPGDKLDPPVASKELHLVARGATDDKGPGYATIWGLQAALADPNLKDKFNVRVVVEAEEESSGNSCKLALENGGSILEGMLQSDVLIASDTKTVRHGHPALTVTLRGLRKAALETESPYDLVRVVHQARDPATGRVRLDGFYDGIVEKPVDAKLQAALEADHRDVYAAHRAATEKPFTAAESCTVRPTFTLLKMDYACADPVEMQGMRTLKISAKGASRDVHSGEYGGAVPEPARDLCNILGGMLESKVDFFIDYMRGGSRAPSTNITSTAEVQISFMGEDDAKVRATIDTLCTRYGFDRSAFTLEDVSDRRAYIEGRLFYEKGEPLYGPEGQAPVAGISSRLVEGQDGQTHFLDPLARHARKVSQGRAQVTDNGGGGMYIMDRAHPMFGTVTRAMARAQGVGSPAELDEVCEGGTIPLISDMQRLLPNVPIYLVGCGTPDGRLHSANENIGVQTGLVTGARTMYRIIEGVALGK